jgi:hypothetical protein
MTLFQIIAIVLGSAAGGFAVFAFINWHFDIEYRRADNARRISALESLIAAAEKLPKPATSKPASKSNRKARQ